MRIGSRLGRPSAPMVVSMVALFVALSSSATAAIVMTGKSIKNGSLTGADIKNKSIPPSKLTRGARVGLKGMPGDQGPAGDPGPAGAQGDPGNAGDYMGSTTAPLLVGQVKLDLSWARTCTWVNPKGYLTAPGQPPPQLSFRENACRMVFNGEWDRRARFAFAQSDTAQATAQFDPMSPDPTFYIHLTDDVGNPADGTAYVSVFPEGQ